LLLAKPSSSFDISPRASARDPGAPVTAAPSLEPVVASDDPATFADLGVPHAMARALAARGISHPTVIQSATIPDALAGHDVCGKAPTGSGKTLAFGIPIVLGVTKAKPRRPRGLVLAPTRELAAQISTELQLLAKPKGPWIESFYGGVGFDRQCQALDRGVDIAVACPGRLADLVNQRRVDLRDVSFVVIDEADRMADMGFLPEVKRLLDQCASQRQTLLFSATLDGDVDVLVRRYQHEPRRHEHVVDADDHDVEHLYWSVDRPRRIETTAALIDSVGPTVVFCRTKRGADRVARQLSDKGVPSAAIHGDRSQSQRDRALRAFRGGEVVALVATDVAARGIHVDDVAAVVHYDLPADDKAYIHRSGRTARAGASGLVVSIVPPDLAGDAAALQRQLGHPTGLTPPRAHDHGARATSEATPRVEPSRSRSKKPRPSGAARRKAKRDTAPSDTVASLAERRPRSSRQRKRRR